MSVEHITKQICLKSQPANIVLIEPFIEEVRKKLEIADEVYGNILVCITEAVNNAILHGNKSDSDKEVTVSIKKESNKLTCLIKDQGCGFDFSNLPDPTAPENIENTGGRGIFLMKHLSDLVVFSNDGSKVEIQFRL